VPTNPLQLFRPRQSDTIVSHIRNLVTQGVLQPGDRIPAERELALELGLGRGTIREAFHQLEALGLVERAARSRVIRVRTSANRASTVSRTIEDERRFLLQIMDVRIGLEGWVASEVARSAQPADLTRLRAILRKIEKAKSAKEVVAVDLQFHRALVEATHNPVVMQILDTLTSMIKSVTAFKKLTLDPLRKVDTSLHRKVIKAVEAGDAAGAQAAMVAHLEMAKAMIGGVSR
jgi:GntR family transcriptional regulator, transcriptional repressor for pyruvate dehydrogenase complex